MDEKDKVIIEIDADEFEAGAGAKPSLRVLAFRIGSEHYGIKISDAKAVFKPASITKVPNAPDFVLGLTNLHGEIVPLVDIRYFLGLGQKEGLAGTKAITTDIKKSLLGVIVDDVEGALDIEESSVQPPLATIKGRLAEFTIGQAELGGKILVLLDLKKILVSDEMEKLKTGETI